MFLVVTYVGILRMQIDTKWEHNTDVLFLLSLLSVDTNPVQLCVHLLPGWLLIILSAEQQLMNDYK